MNTFFIHPVESSQHVIDFHLLPHHLYKHIPAWIAPLEKDVEGIFSKDKNPFFAHGEIIRWNAYDANHKIIGRLAAFTNKRYTNKGDTQATGGIGFFECIHSKKLAHALFDKAVEWLKTRGMQAMDGPINFGERDKWWGLLVEGFHAPIYCLSYSLPYYRDLFEGYGFKPFYEQFCFGMHAKDQLSEEHWECFHKWNADPRISTRYIEKNNLSKYAQDFTTVYNGAWASHEGMKTMSPKRILAMFKQMKAIMIPSIIGFAYDGENPIAMWVNVPDVNEYFRYLKGKWHLWEKLKFLYLLMFYKPKRFVGIVFGVVPEWQGKGIDKYLIVSVAKINPKFPKHLGEYEIQWVGDFNTKMINVIKKLGAIPKRKLITYRYLFDSTQPFVRHPFI